MFLIVRYEDMSLNEQMQHRIGNLPAFRIYAQASSLLMQPSCIRMVNAMMRRTTLLTLLALTPMQHMWCLQGRRYVADGQQSLSDLVDIIEARTVGFAKFPLNPCCGMTALSNPRAHSESGPVVHVCPCPRSMAVCIWRGRKHESVLQGVSPVGPVEVLRFEGARAVLGCNEQVRAHLAPCVGILIAKS